MFCPMAMYCGFAHGVAELREWAAAPNSRYKSKLCNNWVASNGRFCPRGAQCHFAHVRRSVRACVFPVPRRHESPCAVCAVPQGDHELRPEGSKPPASAIPSTTLDPSELRGDSVGPTTQAHLLEAARVARGTSMPGTELDDATLLSEDAVQRANTAIFEAAAAAGILPSARPDMTQPVNPAIFHTGGGLGPKPFIKSGKGGVVVKPGAASGTGSGSGSGPGTGSGTGTGSGSGTGAGVAGDAAAPTPAYFTSPAFVEVRMAMEKSQAEVIRAMQQRHGQGAKKRPLAAVSEG